MIDPSNGMKIKRYVTLADIGHKEQYDDRPFKRHENKKPPPKLLGANLTFQKQAFALPNACRKTHLEINFSVYATREVTACLKHAALS